MFMSASILSMPTRSEASATSCSSRCPAPAAGSGGSVERGVAVPGAAAADGETPGADEARSSSIARSESSATHENTSSIAARGASLTSVIRQAR